jgi:hypothetical protein
MYGTFGHLLLCSAFGVQCLEYARARARMPPWVLPSLHTHGVLAKATIVALAWRNVYRKAGHQQTMRTALTKCLFRCVWHGSDSCGETAQQLEHAAGLHDTQN